MSASTGASASAIISSRGLSASPLTAARASTVAAMRVSSSRRVRRTRHSGATVEVPMAASAAITARRTVQDRSSSISSSGSTP